MAKPFSAHSPSDVYRLGTGRIDGLVGKKTGYGSGELISSADYPLITPNKSSPLFTSVSDQGMYFMVRQDNYSYF